MGTQVKSRRAFLAESATGLGAAWVAANYPAIVAAQEHVRAAAESGEPPTFAFLTPEQAVELDALTAEIIPTDATPGAREARGVAFIDRALVTFERARQADYTKGLEVLLEETRIVFPTATKFSALAAEPKQQVLARMEGTPFFQLVRVHTITGFFSSPVHGGNHDKVGWTLVGYDDSLVHSPPFGYYDALPESRG